MNIRKIVVNRTSRMYETTPITIEERSCDQLECRIQTFDYDGTMINDITLRKDDKNRLLSEETHYPGEDRKNVTKYAHEDNRRFERVYYDDGGNSKTVYNYNDRNAVLSKEQYYDETDDIPFETESFEYNEKGNLLLRKIVDSEQNVIEEEKREYDQNFLLLRSEIRNAEARVMYQYEYGNGKLISVTMSVNDAQTEHSTYSYDNDNNFVEVRTEYLGNTNQVSDFVRSDKKGNIVYGEYTSWQGNKEVTMTVTREYNPEGLIIREKRLSDHDHSTYTDDYIYEYY